MGYSCVKPSLHSYPERRDTQILERLSPRSTNDLLSRGYSPNGQCGPGLTCDPHSTVYTGTCCSQYGWCGDTHTHCGKGCTSGCTIPDPTTTSPAASGTEEPVLGKPSTAPATGSATTDGTCGAGNGNTVCADWRQGSCCSLYGVCPNLQIYQQERYADEKQFCGNTTAHCGEGCQSGPCVGARAVPVPGPSNAPVAPNPGIFNIVGQSGVPAMHAGLMPNGRVIFLDKVENYTQIKLSDGHYAYSAEYDPATNEVVGLSYKVSHHRNFAVALLMTCSDQCLLLWWRFPR